jgi:hypothetical protein
MNDDFSDLLHPFNSLARNASNRYKLEAAEMAARLAINVRTRRYLQTKDSKMCLKLLLELRYVYLQQLIYPALDAITKLEAQHTVDFVSTISVLYNVLTNSTPRPVDEEIGYRHDVVMFYLPALLCYDILNSE